MKCKHCDKEINMCRNKPNCLIPTCKGFKHWNNKNETYLCDDWKNAAEPEDKT